MYITDTETGITRLYGTDQHDSLVKSDDGRCLHYYNLQCGEGSMFGTYVFTDELGRIPKENIDILRYGAEDYFNIGGFGEVHMSQIEDIKAEIQKHSCFYRGTYIQDGLDMALHVINKHMGWEDEE